MQFPVPLVALVDDEESVRKALARLLRAEGYRVITFAGGLDFLRSMGDPPPDCLVLNLRMPRMSGLDVQQKLLERSIAMPVIVITGDDSNDSRERAMRRGAVAFLRKPCDDRDLLQAVDRALQAKALSPA